MDEPTRCFPLEQHISNLADFWGISAIKGTLLPTGKYLVTLEGSHTELLSEFLYEALRIPVNVSVREYDQRCDCLFLLISTGNIPSSGNEGVRI